MNTQRVLSCVAAGVVVVGLSTWLPGCAAPRDAAPGSPARSPDLRSNLQVDAGQTFVYAGEPSTGPYQASVRNVGSVPVRLAKRVNGVDVALITLGPSEATLAQFGAGEAALFENTSGAQAQLTVLIWGETQVGMRYEAARGVAP